MVQGPPNAEETATMATVAMRDFTGVWIKDRAASDLESYARTLDLMKLGGLQKVRFISLQGITSRCHRCTLAKYIDT